MTLISFFRDIGPLDYEEDIPDEIAERAAEGRIKKPADYISTVRSRLISLGLPWDISQARLFAQRMDVINKTYTPNQVKPPNLKDLWKTSRKAQTIIIFWVLGGWRYHAFINITPDDFGQEENGFTIIGNDSKYGPNDEERETRSIPVNIARIARPFFPVSKNYIRDFILEPLSVSSHAFRRLLAILIRRELAQLKWSQVRVN